MPPRTRIFFGDNEPALKMVSWKIRRGGGINSEFKQLTAGQHRLLEMLPGCAVQNSARYLTQPRLPGFLKSRRPQSAQRYSNEINFDVQSQVFARWFCARLIFDPRFHSFLQQV